MSNSDDTIKMSDAELQDLVIESDTGARKPRKWQAIILLSAALIWSLFQLWIASPLPYTDFARALNIPILNSNYARFIHLAFALFLAYMAYPATKKSPRRYIPFLDWVMLSAAVFSVLYLYVNREALAMRTGIPTQVDVAVAVIGILLLLEAARRALGPPLVIIAGLFLFYTFAGNASFMPEVIAHKGQSLNKVASHQWLTSEGVFGIAIGVSTDFVFLFVLFGALLEKAGAGNYFIKLAFSLLGHLRGGPAKAAVLASAMTGLISGSSIANVVTTGTFTVPLMRRVGFSREKAGAVEVASSVNGQIMPPVMGAAAFLMVEYVGISYVEVVKAAFIPAIISYIALLYIVHLEALKAGIQPIPKTITKTLFNRVITTGITVSSLIILAGIAYYAIAFIKTLFGSYAVYVILLSVITLLVSLLWYASKFPDLEMDNPNIKAVKLPDTMITLKTGLHYILPIVVLVWCLMVERLSPGLSAFWATIFMIFIVVTQNPIKEFFRKRNKVKEGFKEGMIDLLDGLITGARNMIGIAIATAAAGIIVGSVSLTGVGQVMTELIEIVSGGSFILVLIFTALICLVLGMGLPTTANYIVVASLMATVIEELGRQNGMIIPLIAIHLFVFYFGIMADVTPPVGLASFAAAAVSGGSPLKTGVQAFIYSIRTVILPFIFIYNTDLLLIGVESFLHGFIIFFKATVAILIFAAATQGYFIVKNKPYETLLLLFISFSIFRAGYWVDIVTPPYQEGNIYKIEEALESANEGDIVRINVLGESVFGDDKEFYAFITAKNGVSGAKQLKDYGLILGRDGNKVIVDDVVFNSPAEKAGFDFDYRIKEIDVPQSQMHRAWVYALSSLLLFIIISAQRSRKSEIISLNN